MLPFLRRSAYLESRAMRISLLALVLLALCSPLTGCKRSLSTRDVNEFIDKSDNATRKRYAPEICELRGEKFTQTINFQGYLKNYAPTKIELNRKLFCQELTKLARIRAYKLERKSIDIDLAPDRKTAVVKAEYEETRPYYDPESTPVTPDDFRDWQVIQSREESVVGIEGGDIVFLSTTSDADQTLVPTKDLAIPFS